MAQISIFQAAGIVVVALMCFSKESYATTTESTSGTTATTTGPTTTMVSTTMGPTTLGPTTTEGATTTEPTGNATIEPTTTAGNMSSTTPSVTSGGTTSSPGAGWQVKDKDGKLCMLMDFSGTINVINRIPVEIPTSASASRSYCDSPSYAAFSLGWGDFFTSSWHIGLNFTLKGSSFQLHEVSASTVQGWISFSGSLTTNFFTVPVGSYYNCSQLNIVVAPFQINLTMPSLQPFVQKTKEGDTLGEPYQCRSSLPVIIGIVIAVIVITVVAVVIGVTYCVVRRRRNPSSQGYKREA